MDGKVAKLMIFPAAGWNQRDGILPGIWSPEVVNQEMAGDIGYKDYVSGKISNWNWSLKLRQEANSGIKFYFVDLPHSIRALVPLIGANCQNS